MSDTSNPSAPDSSALQAPSVPRQSGAKPKKPAPVTHYRIVHSLVGEYRGGDIVSAETFKSVDVQRLIDLGAIAAAADPNEDSE